MNTAMMIECIGYAGSILVLISFLMTSVVKLRIVNSVGGVIFATYAMIIHSYPTAVMNICLVLINLHFLWRLRNQGNSYEMVCVDSRDQFLNYLLKEREEDIKKCFPGLCVDLAGVNKAWLVCCNMAPASILLGNDNDGNLDIALDYSLPAYRDCSVGEYLMSSLPRYGIRRLSYSGPTENHRKYLAKMGFVLQNGAYVKNLE